MVADVWGAVGGLSSLAAVGVTLLVLKVARDTLASAREDQRIQRQERASRRLGDVIDVAAKTYFAILNANGLIARPLQAQLAALVGVLKEEIPETRRLGDAPLTNNDEFIAAQIIAESALRELATVARQNAAD